MFCIVEWLVFLKRIQVLTALIILDIYLCTTMKQDQWYKTSFLDLLNIFKRYSTISSATFNIFTAWEKFK